MKILFITPTFPPNLGGLPLMIYEIAKGLALRGHEILVFTTSMNGRAVEEKEGAVTVYRYRPVDWTIQGYLQVPRDIVPRWLNALTNHIIKDVDIVQTFGRTTHFAHVVGAVLKLLRGKRLLVRPNPGRSPLHLQRLVQEFFSEDYSLDKDILRELDLIRSDGVRGMLSSIHSSYRRLYDDFISYSIFRYADHCFAQTSLGKEMFVKIGLKPEKISIIPRGISTNEYRQLPDPSIFRHLHHINPEEKVILYVGSIGFWKGTPHLIVAMREVLQENPRVRLVIVSQSGKKTEDHIQQFAPPQVREHILLAGSLTGEALASAYSAADVFAFTSLDEGFGNVILEAAASGLPIVATKVGVAPDIITHGENGLFVKYGDVEGISEAIKKILADNSFKSRAEERRHSVLEAYDVEKEVDSYEKTYYHLLAHS